MLLLTVRGTPFVYYGEAIGMTDGRIPRREMVDPTGITFWLLPLGRDGERTPMQWTAGENAGFCPPGVKPWLRVHPNRTEINVDAQRHDPESLWHWYRNLIRIRKETPALLTGSFSFLETKNRSILAWRRCPDGSTVSLGHAVPPPPGSVDCYLNFSGRTQTVIIPESGRVLAGNRRNEKETLPAGALPLAAHEALLVSF